ncbi:hypothetical protein [Vogesella alkaliphila]|uniref:hypothetical protein n=1 Tax=Vogesella alkaliphila TaxID=1193621 RepID=UPI00167AFCCE|nr:hypothetical protein [Vogesella alkaliphila]
MIFIWRNVLQRLLSYIIKNEGEFFSESCSKRTKSEARKIAGFVHLIRGEIHRSEHILSTVGWAEPAKPNLHHTATTKVGRKPSQVCGQPCFCLGYPLRGCFYLPLSARRRLPFFCFAKKKASKEKATRRRRNSRKNGHQPGAAHTLRSKEGGLFPGWRPFLRPAPTGAGRAGSVPADG